MAQPNDILSKSESLVSQIPVDGSDGLLGLQRDPTQLESAIKALSRDAMEEDSSNMFHRYDMPGGQQTGKKKEFLRGRADRLLSQYNFDADKLERELHQIVPRVSQQGKDKVVYDHHAQVVSTTIHEAMMAGDAETDFQARRQLEETWEADKKKLLQELNQMDPASADMNNAPLDVRANAVSHMPVGLTPYGRTPSSSEQITAAPEVARRANGYLQTLKENLSNADGLLEELQRCGTQFDDNLPSCEEVWLLAKSIQASVRSNPNNPLSWFVGSRVFLEGQYLRFRVKAKDKNQSDLSAVCNWLKSTAASPSLGERQLSDLLNTHSRKLSEQTSDLNSSKAEPLYAFNETKLPFWAVVYYSFRSGAWHEAIEVLKNDKSGDATVQAVYEYFAQYLDDSNTFVGYQVNPDSRVLQQLEKVASELGVSRTLDGNENTGSIWNNSPWLNAVLFMVQQGASAKLFQGSVNASIQDYMWMKLCLITLRPPNHRGQQELISGLQDTLLRSGQGHFSDGNDPQLFARVLLMAKKPAEALKYLAESRCQGTTDTCISDAVHIAVALRQEMELDDLKDVSQLIVNYVERFAAVKLPLDGLLYLNLFAEGGIARELHDGFVAVLLAADGDNLSVHKVLGEELRAKVLLTAGMKFNSRDETFKALKLLSSSEVGYQDAFVIACKGLMKSIRQGQNFETWLKTAKSKPFSGESSVLQRVPTKLIDTFNILRDILEFMQLCESQSWSEALNRVQVLFPLEPAHVNRKIEDYYTHDDLVLEIFPLVAEKAIDALAAYKASPASQSTKWKQILEAFESFFAQLRLESSHKLSQKLSEFQKWQYN